MKLRGLLIVAILLLLGFTVFYILNSAGERERLKEVIQKINELPYPHLSEDPCTQYGICEGK
jgi:PDZ domain-containing secreted protein